MLVKTMSKGAENLMPTELDKHLQKSRCKMVSPFRIRDKVK